RFDGTLLGEWRARLQVSPHFPMGTTYDEMFAVGRRGSEVSRPGGETADPLTFGTGIVAAFLRRVLQGESIGIRVGPRVTRLLRDGNAVVGLEADSPKGSVAARGEVVLATSAYDWDPAMVDEFLGLGPDDFGSAAPRTIAGDGIRLARE